MAKKVRTNEQGVVYTSYRFPSGFRSIEDYTQSSSNGSIRHEFGKLERTMNKLEQREDGRTKVYVTFYHRMVKVDERLGEQQVQEGWMTMRPGNVVPHLTAYGWNLVELLMDKFEERHVPE
jgi:hypothetical protein